MTAIATCGHCGKPLTVSPAGRPKAYCDDRCRNAAREARAAKQVGASHSPTAAPETPQRPSYAGRGLGDGDPCPQDPSHGRMYFVGADKRRQWCPSSSHRGSSFYAFDGVTPAPRTAVRAGVESNAVPQPGTPRPGLGLLLEAPGLLADGASIPEVSNQPAGRFRQDGYQVGLPLAD